MNQIYDDYARLNLEISALETKRDNLRALILDDLIAKGAEKQALSYGTFTKARRVTWKYSPKVEKLEEKLKITKHHEQMKGLAEAKETHYLLFTPKV